MMKGYEKPRPLSIANIQNANWSGTIPVVLSLDATSLSSTSMPRPLYKMIPRMSYLHLAFYEEVLQLFQYAPAVSIPSIFSGTSVVVREEPNDTPPDDTPSEHASRSKSDGVDDNLNNTTGEEDVMMTQGCPGRESTPSLSPKETQSSRSSEFASYPNCWFEDEVTGVPLRWHLFVGVLYDLMKGIRMMHHSSFVSSSDESARSCLLPWKIKVHFTAYPTSLLPFDDGVRHENNSALSTQDRHNSISRTDCRIKGVIGRTFRNSLKQALFMQYNSSKVAMSITKKSHEKMWDAILNSDFDSYHEVNIHLQVGLASTHGSGLSTVKLSAPKDHNAGIPELIPVRVLLNSNPAMQKPCQAFNQGSHENNQRSNDDQRNEGATEEETLDNLVEHLTTCTTLPQNTLGDVLMSWLPQYFAESSSDPGTNDDSPPYYCISGIKPSLSCPILDLWKSLCHPDHFIYVIVVV